MSFNVRRHYPTGVDFWMCEDALPEPLAVDANVEVSGGPNTNNPLDWRVHTKVTFEARSKEKVAAKGTIAFVGFFDVPKEVPEDAREKFILLNSTSILYAATRELVANLSARAPNKLITLPPAFFSGAQSLKPGDGQVVSATV